MMGKINIDKLKSFEPIRPERQADVKSGQTPPIRPPQAETSTKDRVDFSGRAAEVGKLVTELKELPDVRPEKVASVRAQVVSGEFNPTNGEIADAIVREELK